MDNRRVVIRLSALATLAAAACTSSAARTESAGESATPPDTAAARAAITRMNAEFSSLATSRNSDSVAAWFAPDAMILAVGAPAIRGRDAIRTFYDQFFQAMPVREMSYVTQDLAFSGDLAIETGASTLSLGGPGQATPVTVAGKYLAVWKRQPDGRWLLWRQAPSPNVLPR